MSWWDDAVGMAGQGQSGQPGQGFNWGGALQAGLQLGGQYLASQDQEKTEEDDELGYISRANLARQDDMLRQLLERGYGGGGFSQANQQAQWSADRAGAQQRALAASAPQGNELLAARMAARNSAMAQGSVRGMAKPGMIQEQLAARALAQQALGQYGQLQMQAKNPAQGFDATGTGFRTPAIPGDPQQLKLKPKSRRRGA